MFATRHMSFRRKLIVPVVALAALTVAVAIAQPVLQLQRAAAAVERRLGGLEDAVEARILDQRVLDELRRTGKARAIVHLDVQSILDQLPGGSHDRASELAEVMSTAIAARKQALLRSLDAETKVARDFENIGAAVVVFSSERALLRAVNSSLVREVSANETVELAGNESMVLIRQREAAQSGYLGAGAYVGVLDTGLNASAFPSYFPAGSVAGTREIAPDDYSLDDHGHGTHVASTVLLVAPRAKVFAADVFHYQWSNGKLKNLAASENILAGMDWMIALKRQGYPLRAVNLSLGGGHYTQSCGDAYHFAEAHSVGIIPVVAAGNSAYEDDLGRETSTYQPGVGHPGCSPYALTVGATTDGSSGCTAAAAADSVAYFSQASIELDLLAPGACITAAGGNFQGTSMAAPHVAGAAAVLAAARPSASANDIRTALFSTGKAIRDSRSGITRNRLDVVAALSKLLGTSGSTNPVDTTAPTVVAPQHSITSGAALAGDGRVHATMRWSGQDASGIARFVLRVRSDGSAWSDVTLASSTATSAALWLTPGVRYQFTVAAQDRAGNWSAWATGTAFTVGSYAENHAATSYSGSWTRAAWVSAAGGALSVSSESGAYGCIRFQGSHVAWVATMATNRGAATIWIDGARQGTVDLYSATVRARTVAFSQTVTPGTVHTMCVQVAGTSGRPAVDIDGFVVLY